MRLKKREIPQSGNGVGGLFLKLKDGDTLTGVFRGEVYEFFQVWENGKSQVVTEDHPQAKSRFRLNFVTKEEGELKAKIFEFGLTVYNQLAELSEEYDLEATAVKITRRGTGTDTLYMIMPAKQQPTAQGLKAIKAVDLVVLEHKDALVSPSTNGSRPANHADPMLDDTPFDELPF